MSETLLKKVQTDKGWKERMQLKKPTKTEIPRGYSKKMIEDRWRMLLSSRHVKESTKEKIEISGMSMENIKNELLDPDTFTRSELFKDNIENFIGTVKVPVGIAGPLRVNGLHANGDYYIPLATTEAALVASISRGISCINQCGGATAAVILEGVSRDPTLVFRNLTEIGQFMAWAVPNFETFKAEAEKTTRFGKLIDMKYTLEGNYVHIKCLYTTGDASGQNIVTIATEAILDYIVANSPIKPASHFLEGGMSGDKKANHLTMATCRGKRVIAEVILAPDVIESTLHATPEQLIKSSSIGSAGLLLTGSIGQSCHFANAITAMSIALGQDPACASESHIGIARGTLLEDRSVHLTVTLPNMLVATVGGGTKLPSQKACLDLMGLAGNGKGNALAEVMACVCIAGEISLGAAIVSGDFAKAHKILARDTSGGFDESESLQLNFEKAQAMVVKLSHAPSKDAILKIYGLYKQATAGDINISKPSRFSMDVKAKMKYEAWKRMKGVGKDEAMRQYIQVVKGLVQDEQSKLGNGLMPTSSSSMSMASSSEEFSTSDMNTDTVAADVETETPQSANHNAAEAATN